MVNSLVTRNIQVMPEQLMSRAKEIINLAGEDLITYPEQKYSWYTQNTLLTYYHVRIFASSYLGIDPLKRPLNEGTQTIVANILYENSQLIAEGAAYLASKQSVPVADAYLITNIGQILNAGLMQSEYKPDQQPYFHNFFFILALDELLNFVMHFNNSYKTEKDRKSAKIREKAYQNVINANGSLLNAVNALEKGVHFSTFTALQPSSTQLKLRNAEITRSAFELLAVQNRSNVNKRHIRDSKPKKVFILRAYYAKTYRSRKK